MRRDTAAPAFWSLAFCELFRQVVLRWFMPVDPLVDLDLAWSCRSLLGTRCALVQIRKSKAVPQTIWSCVKIFPQINKMGLGRARESYLEVGRPCSPPKQIFLDSVDFDGRHFLVVTWDPLRAQWRPAGAKLELRINHETNASSYAKIDVDKITNMSHN